MKFIRGKRSPLTYVIVVLVLGPLLTMGLVVAYVHNQVGQSETRIHAEEAKNDRRWCVLLVRLDQQLPPNSTIKPIIHDMRGQFGCPSD